MDWSADQGGTAWILPTPVRYRLVLNNISEYVYSDVLCGYFKSNIFYLSRLKMLYLYNVSALQFLLLCNTEQGNFYLIMALIEQIQRTLHSICITTRIVICLTETSPTIRVCNITLIHARNWKGNRYLTPMYLRIKLCLT